MHGSVSLPGTTGFGTALDLGDISSGAGGWTAGGGYEQLVWDRWTAKFEYLYMRSDDVSVTSTVQTIPVTTTGHFTNNVVRVGLNYHF